MKVYRDCSTIELTWQEGDWLRLPDTAPPEALRGDDDFVYRKFEDKLKDVCSELYRDQEVTVLIYCGDSEAANFNENGLNFLDEYYKPESEKPGA